MSLINENELNWASESGYKFPSKAFEILKNKGYLSLNLPPHYGGKSDLTTAQLLNTLRRVGAVELSVGRLYEGHINALDLIDRYADKDQKKRYFQEAAAGHVFGIWNTNSLQEPVNIDAGQRLEGSKIFCSGGLSIHRPIITAQHDGKTFMVIVHSEDLEKTREDASSWKPMGMKASRSHTIDFNNYKIEAHQLLGSEDDYMQEPHFSTGAVRFAAVQLGGAQAIAYTAIEHLKKLDRTKNPHQQVRMGKMSIALESGKNWLKQTGAVMDNPNISDDDKINHANMVRTAILESATQIMHLAEQAVGLAGMMEDHKLEQLLRDLTTYLKQPGPDRALTQVGAWSATTNNGVDVYS